MKKSGAISGRGLLPCELCGGQARMYCESDRASLCWDCDVKVHAANFLVAKHTRTVLCGLCHSRTPWKAAGRNLGRMVSVCDRCCGGRLSAGTGRVRDEGVGGLDEEERQDGRRREVDSGFDDEDVDGDDEVEEDDSCTDYEQDDDGGGDGDDENQVVPWSSPETARETASNIGDEEQSSGGRATAIKRMHDFAFLHSDMSF